MGFLAAVLMSTAPASAAVGDLDPTFSSDGFTTAGFGAARAGAHGLVRQSDGRLLVAGTTAKPSGTAGGSDVAIARFNADGSLDTTLDSDGKATTDFGGTDSAAAVAVQTDGKFVVVGTTSSPTQQPGQTTSDIAIARYNPNGSLDSTFSGDGKATTDLGAKDFGMSVTVLSDGKVLVAGQANGGLVLVRYNADGTVDTGFGSNGFAQNKLGDLDSGAAALAVQSDGKIVAVGGAGRAPNGPLANSATFVVARYSALGALDSSFGTGGVTTSKNGGGNAWFSSVAIDTSGKIIVAGTGHSQMTTARLLPNGTFDSSYGTGGFAFTNLPGEFNYGNAVALQPNGAVVAVGVAGEAQTWDLAVARFLPTGALDTSFSSDGLAITDLDGEEDGNALALQPDGGIVVAGEIFADDTSDFLMVRYQGATVTPPTTSPSTQPPTTQPPAPVPTITIGQGAGGTGLFKTVKTSGETIAGPASVFANYTGSVSVARGDVDSTMPGDEIVVGTGLGWGPTFVNVYSASGTFIRQITPYGSSFTGGVFVAVGNVTGDSTEEVITGAGAGGGPHVRVFAGNGTPVGDGFYAFGSQFAGGVRVAVGRLFAGNYAQIVTAAGPGGGPHVRVFSGSGDAQGDGFFAYGPSFTGGVFPAVGNLGGDALGEIVTGAGAGGGPHVRVFNGNGSPQGDGFFAYGPSFSGGVSVAVGDTDGETGGEIITGAGAGGGPHIRTFTNNGVALGDGFYGFDPSLRGGVSVSFGGWLE